MQQAYTLLRNNQQTGPYSLEELLQLGLKPHDLLWVEGQSTGWKHPVEIEELQPYLHTTVRPGKQGNASSAGTRHVYVSLPARQKTELPHMPTKDEEPKLSFEERIERVQQKVTDYHEHQQAEEDGLNTGYSRSLQEVESEYAGWKEAQKKKQRKAVRKKRLLQVAATIVVIALTSGYLTGLIRGTNETSPPEMYMADEAGDAQTVALHEDVEEPPVHLQTVFPYRAEGNLAEPSDSQKDSAVIQQPAVKSEQQKAAPDKEEKTRSTTDLATKKPQIGITPEKKVTPAATEIKQPDTVQKNPPTINHLPAAKESASVPLPRLVDVAHSHKPLRGDRGITDLKLTVNNQSDQLLNMVAVEVSYYNAHKRLLRKQTVYLNNIPAHTTSSIFAPQMKRASSVETQIGLIRSNGTLYYTK